MIQLHSYSIIDSIKKTVSKIKAASLRLADPLDTTYIIILQYRSVGTGLATARPKFP